MESSQFHELIKIIGKRRFLFSNEKLLQFEIYQLLLEHYKEQEIRREFALEKGSIIDFLLLETIGIEIKIKGQKMAIYRQCERYCTFPIIKSLVLITSKSIGMPEKINGKPILSINISKAWL